MPFRKPLVTALRYRIESRDDFGKAVPLEFETEVFKLEVANGEAIFTMKEPFDSAVDATLAVTPFIRSWEIATGLANGPESLKLIQTDVSIVDLEPDGDFVDFSATLTGCLTMSDSVRAVIGRAAYPAPPTKFRATDLVEGMWHRLSLVNEGREPAPSAAYYCLTCIEDKFGGRPEAAKALKISKKVLDRFARLSSSVGDEKTARKYLGDDVKPHTAGELNWITSGIKLIIKRLAIYEAGGIGDEVEVTQSEV